jgi:protein-S-isoprenylcysteine O-methyltransferase Ste14
MTLIEINIIYGLAWLSFGLGHSILASANTKNYLAVTLGPYYRLAYNVFASLHIAAVWMIGKFGFAGISSFTISPSVQIVFWVLTILGGVILLAALRSYDLGRLAGTTQIKNHKAGLEEPEDEPLNTTGMHAYIRHPLYAGAYFLLWGRAFDEFGIATAIWGSIYLGIGTYFEERRLIALRGEAYNIYRQKVPAIIPSIFPWRGRNY